MENRKWMTIEKFLDYANDKCMLAATLNLDKIELVEYIIGGIQDETLQNQARINRFQTVAGLVRAFSLVQLKQVFKPKICYHCNQPGHVAVNCGFFAGNQRGPQNRGNFGSKPFGGSSSRGELGGALGGPSAGQPGRTFGGTSARVTPGGPSTKGQVWIGAVEDENDGADLIGQTADGLVDIKFKNSLKTFKAFETGSPVSLVRHSKVLDFEILSFEQNKFFKGLGGNNLNILGKIISDISFQKISFRTEFLVVADTDLSSFDAIIGRDIIMKPGIKTIIEENKIKK